MKAHLAVTAFFLASALMAWGVHAEKVNVTLMSCKDLLCTVQKGAFLLNESAYIDYNSSEKEITYSAVLTFPDGKSYQINFPNRVVSNETGKYIVNMTVWKDGFEETKVYKEFSFIDSSPQTPAVENPPTLDIVPMLVIAIPIVIVLALWMHSNRKHKKISPQKSVYI